MPTPFIFRRLKPIDPSPAVTNISLPPRMKRVFARLFSAGSVQEDCNFDYGTKLPPATGTDMAKVDALSSGAQLGDTELVNGADGGEFFGSPLSPKDLSDAISAGRSFFRALLEKQGISVCDVMDLRSQIYRYNLLDDGSFASLHDALVFGSSKVAEQAALLLLSILVDPDLHCEEIRLKSFEIVVHAASKGSLEALKLLDRLGFTQNQIDQLLDSTKVVCDSRSQSRMMLDVTIAGGGTFSLLFLLELLAPGSTGGLAIAGTVLGSVAGIILSPSVHTFTKLRERFRREPGHELYCAFRDATEFVALLAKNSADGQDTLDDRKPDAALPIHQEEQVTGTELSVGRRPTLLARALSYLLNEDQPY